MILYLEGTKIEVDGEFHREVLCEGCLATIGFLSSSEIQALSAGGEKVFCFDCDKVDGDEIPYTLLPDVGQMIVIFNEGRTRLLAYVCDEIGRFDVIKRDLKAAALSTSLTNLHTAFDAGLDPISAGQGWGGENEHVPS